MRAVPIFLVLIVGALLHAQIRTPESITQSTSGQCSQAVFAGGNVTITCTGLNDRQLAMMDRLSGLVEELLRQQSAEILSKLDDLVKGQRTVTEASQRILEAIAAITKELPNLRGLEVPTSIRTLTTLGDQIIPVTVSTYQGLSLKQEDIDQILATASVVLRSCNVRLVRAGVVQQNSNDVLDSSENWRNIMSYSKIPHLQILSQISWCDGRFLPSSVTLGCAIQNGNDIALAGAHHSPADLGLVLAHEIGHIAGLSHRPTGLSGNTTSLMDEVLKLHGKKLKTFPVITPIECEALSALARRPTGPAVGN